MNPAPPRSAAARHQDGAAPRWVTPPATPDGRRPIRRVHASFHRSQVSYFLRLAGHHDARPCAFGWLIHARQSRHPQVGLSVLPRCQIVSCQVRAVANEPHRMSRASGLQCRSALPIIGLVIAAAILLVLRHHHPRRLTPPHGWGRPHDRGHRPNAACSTPPVAVSIFEYAFCAVHI